MVSSKIIKDSFIIIITTQSNENDKEIYKRIGADSFIPKPVTRNDLLKALNEYLAPNLDKI